MTKVNISTLDVENHILRQLYGEFTRYGAKPPTADVKANGAKLMLAVAGADKRITARQREAFVNVCNVIGVPASSIEALRNAEPHAWNPSELSADARPFAGIFVSEGIRVACAETVDAAKREAIVNIAKQVGVNPSFVADLESLVLAEKTLRANRYRLLASPRVVTKLGTGPLVEAGAHARSFELGQDVGPMPADVGYKAGRAMLTVAAGDGEITATELAHFLGIAASMGVPREGLEDFAAFDGAKARLTDYFDDSVRPLARIVLLDAVRTARADGFAQKERALAKRGAKNLGIEESWVDALEAQLLAEDGIRNARIALLGKNA